MTNLKFKIAFFALFCFQPLCNAQHKHNPNTRFKTIQQDFKTIMGDWEGTLIYLDYSSGKPYEMPINININRIGKSNQFVFAKIYPNEPKANATDTVILSVDGKYINKEQITARQKQKNGNTQIITEQVGKDGNDNKEAIFRHTYTLGKKGFSKKKEVQFVGTTQWIKRHEYSCIKK